MKACIVCGEVKRASEFGIRRVNKDGRNNKCRPCMTAYQRDYQRRNRKRLRDYEREWYRRDIEKNRQVKRDYKRKRYHKDREQILKRLSQCPRERARQKIRNAVRRGYIIRPKQCPNCATAGSRIEAHHDDYSKPFAVEWLCSLCHREKHHLSTREDLSFSPKIFAAPTKAIEPAK